MEGENPSLLYEMTKQALENNVTHFDCAELYASSQHVGRAFNEIIEHTIPRSTLHITSKLKGMPSGSYDQIRERLTNHLNTLSLAYVDLLLIHWPGQHDTDLSSNDDIASKCTWSYFDTNIEAAWINMQRLQTEGLTKQIGVSNFYLSHLQRLPEPPPFANEIYLDITHQENVLCEYMNTHNIQCIAYRTLAFLRVVAMASQSKFDL